MTEPTRTGPKYKIHPDQYPDIIKSRFTVRLLARQYGVTECTIRKIIRDSNHKPLIGRATLGRKTKIEPDQYQTIKSLQLEVFQIARLYKVSQATIYKILRTPKPIAV